MATKDIKARAAAKKAATEEKVKETKGTGNIVDEQYRKRYGKEGHCGDELAAAMKAADTEGHNYISVADENGIDVSRWANLNAGQQRMNLSNVLRGKLRKGEEVTVQGKKINPKPYVAKAQEQKEAAQARKATKKSEKAA